MTPVSIVTDCLQGTTMHGVSHLTKSMASLFSRIFWAVSILFSLGVFLFHVSTLVCQYNDMPTGMNIIPGGAVYLIPDIYVCPLAPLSNFLQPPEEKYQNASSLAKDLDWLNRRLEEIQVLDDDYETFWNSVPTPLLHRLFGHQSTFNEIKKLSEAVAKKMKYKITTAVIPHLEHLACIRIRRTKGDSYTRVVVPEFGIRPTLNFTDGGINNTLEAKNIPSIVSTASSNGFNISNKPLSSFQFGWKEKSKKGFCIYVVPKDHYPHTQSTRFSVQSHQKIRIYLKMEKRSFKSTPNYRCHPNPDPVHLVNHLKEGSSVYFQDDPDTCYYRQFHNFTMHKCNCTAHIYPFQRKKLKQGIKFCYDIIQLMKHITPEYKPHLGQVLTVQEKKAILKQKKKNFVCVRAHNRTVIEEACANLRPCIDLMYSYDLDTQKAPGSISILSFYDIERKSNYVVQSFTYGFKNLLSDVGGILGFYIGVSVLTICELIGLVFHIIYVKSTPTIPAETVNNNLSDEEVMMKNLHYEGQEHPANSAT